MYETRYFRASSIVDAHDLFSKGEEPAFLAGGHTLIPTMKSRLVRADRLIDIRAIPETQGLRTADGTLFLGSSTTHATVAASPEVVSTFPVLAGLAGSIGDVQVRHMGTIGGSVANCDPAADYPAAVLGAGARIVTDRRTMDADDFFCGLYATALEEGEIILRFEFPIPAEAAYAKFRNPASRYALAAVFVTRSAGGDIRVAVTGAGNDGVFRWREAEDALAHDFDAQSLEGLQVDPADMMADMHASSAYRADLVSVLAQRAVRNMGCTLIY